MYSSTTADLAPIQRRTPAARSAVLRASVDTSTTLYSRSSDQETLELVGTPDTPDLPRHDRLPSSSRATDAATQYYRPYCVVEDDCAYSAYSTQELVEDALPPPPPVAQVIGIRCGDLESTPAAALWLAPRGPSGDCFVSFSLSFRTTIGLSLALTSPVRSEFSAATESLAHSRGPVFGRMPRSQPRRRC